MIKFSIIQIVASFFILLCVTSLVQADDYDFEAIHKKHKTQVVLALDAAIEEALTNNALLDAAKANATAKRARIQPSGALEDPTLELAASNYPITSLSPRQSGMTGNEAMFVQKFPYPGKRRYLEQVAIEEFQSSKEEIDSARLDLIKAVKSGYYDLFLSYKREEILDHQYQLLRSLQAIARSKFSLGATPQTDVLEFQLKSVELILKLQEQEKNISTQRAELNHLLGRVGHLSTWRPQTLIESKINLVHVANWADESLGVNPKIGSLRAQVSAASSKVGYSKLNIYPDFEVGVGYMQRFSNMDDNGTDFISARVGITLPFFQGDKQRERISEAEAEKRKAESLLREGQLELSHDLHAALAEITEAKNKLSLYKKAILPLTDATLSSARKAYETNQASYLPMLNLINSRLEAETGYYEALVQHERAVTTIEALMGKSVLELRGKEN